MAVLLSGCKISRLYVVCRRLRGVLISNTNYQRGSEDCETGQGKADMIEPIFVVPSLVFLDI